MPHWPFFSATTPWTVSRSVPDAHRPCLAKPLRVSELMVTSLTRFLSVPVTQIPSPALAQLPEALPGTMTVERAP